MTTSVNTSTYEKVVEILAENLSVDPSKISPESRFNEDLGADSLDTVELVMKFEEVFGCSISDSVAETLKTVKDVTDYLDSQKRSAEEA